MPPARTTLAICCAATLSLAVAMGIGRFAFTPMFPLMLRDGLLHSADGAWLAGSNYLGYLLGAMLAARLRLAPARLLAGSLIGICLLTAAMGMTQLLYVWLVWRLLAGLLSAWALVATSAWALSWLAVTGRAQWAGLIYSGVGLGIMLAGVFCLLAARSGICATTLWRWLALLAALLSLLPLYWCQRHAQVPVVASAQAAPPADAPASSAGLVLCYGLFGFGYILPATYLPQMARRLLDDPTVFGWTWPLFGLAALLSTLMTLCARQRVSRVRAWALAQLLMALGVLLPALWPTLSALLLAALLVGGNFMVITMLGMQEARARAPHQATRVLGRMTAAFALGQLAGPLLMLLLQCRPATQGHALTLALVSGAASLLFSAAYLWRCPSA